VINRHADYRRTTQLSKSRQAILGRLKQAIGRDAASDATTQVAERTPPARYPEARLRPASGGDRLERFVLQVQASGATVTRVRNRAAIASAVMEFVREHDLDPAIVVSADPVLEDIDWPSELKVDCRAAIDRDRTSVTGAVAAVSETGSVVIESGRSAPNSLAFLPDNHLSVVLTDQLVSHLDDVLALYGADANRTDMPRAVSFITGPSKTADVEQTLQHGAHGPKRKHVILVDDAGID